MTGLVMGVFHTCTPHAVHIRADFCRMKAGGIVLAFSTVTLAHRRNGQIAQPKA
jgi:hypothetical protein